MVFIQKKITDYIVLMLKRSNDIEIWLESSNRVKAEYRCLWSKTKLSIIGDNIYLKTQTATKVAASQFK